MAKRVTQQLVNGGSFFECPRWHDGRWWVSDFHRHSVFAITPGGEQTTALVVDAQPAGLGWMPDGSLLVASMIDRRLLRQRPDGTVEEHADLSAHCPGNLNDMTVDAVGRAYVGNFGYDVVGGETRRPTSVVRVDPDGSITTVADDLHFPNGAVISPDGRTYVVTETMASRITAFTVYADGGLSERREWARLAAPPATAEDAVESGPDGCCLDAEGCIWVADAFQRKCLRLSEGGTVLDEITVEGLGLYACMLGGEDGRTLLLCAAPNFGTANRRNARDASLLVTQVDVPRAGLP
jgi:sugar lactone lactonase YvrE